MLERRRVCQWFGMINHVEICLAGIDFPEILIFKCKIKERVN